MSQLSAKTRAQLRNTAFAYIDSKGRRRLPIHDEAHVRNALARFNQTRFEDDAARERARKRLLTAAKKYGIVPIGFISGQLATERLEGESSARAGVVRKSPSSCPILRILPVYSAFWRTGTPTSWVTCVASSAALCNGRGARKSTFARTNYLLCSSARTVRSLLRWRSSRGSAHGHGQSAPKCGSGSASIPVVPHRPTAATWGWQCTLRPAYALPVTAVKSCSRATRYGRSKHRLLATSAFAA